MMADDKLKLEQALQFEYTLLMANDTWLGRTAKKCKSFTLQMGLQKKFTSGDPNPIYKAKPGAKGFKQENGFDFDEILSPVVKMRTLRTILDLVAIEDIKLVQMDVKTTFLHGDLDEDVHMQ
ncbi:hypothetical protein L7F22_032319 [Adiantum nelumboides]|nr:hypothetical protein [Adiantum nelumboides]